MQQPPIKELEKRLLKLRAIVTGDVSNFLTNFIKSDLSGNLSEHQSQRLNKALSQEIQLYPETRGMYIAHTEDKDSSYVVSLKPASCTCGDFIYNCDYKAGECCKHIWKIRAMVSIEALPPYHSLPNLWTLTLIQDDIDTAKQAKQDFSDLITELENLQREIANTDWYNIDYQNVYYKWYTVLEDSDITT